MTILRLRSTLTNEPPSSNPLSFLDPGIRPLLPGIKPVNLASQ
jgi:hypothetical protein